MGFERFEDIKGWQKARELTQQIYQLTKQESFSRDPSLVDQLRRASVSITSNIAEGFERDGEREFARYLKMAKGSSAEVRSQLYVAKDEKYISDEQFNKVYELASEVSKILNGLIKSIQNSFD